MTQKEKDLLLKDLCARLPYKVQVFVERDKCAQATLLGVDVKQFSIIFGGNNWSSTSDIEGHHIEQYKQIIKLYLRPISSMTEEEKNELRNILWFGYPSDDNDNYSHRGIEVKQCLYDDEKHSTYNFDDFMVLQNFLLKNHFDYCGLIPRGLALEAPKGMYNIK